MNNQQHNNQQTPTDVINHFKEASANLDADSFNNFVIQTLNILRGMEQEFGQQTIKDKLYLEFTTVYGDYKKKISVMALMLRYFEQGLTAIHLEYGFMSQQQVNRFEEKAQENRVMYNL